MKDLFIGSFLKARQTSENKFSVDSVLEGEEKSSLLSNLSINKYGNIGEFISFIEEKLGEDYQEPNSFWGKDMLNSMKRYKEDFEKENGIEEEGLSDDLLGDFQ